MRRATKQRRSRVSRPFRLVGVLIMTRMIAVERNGLTVIEQSVGHRGRSKEGMLIGLLGGAGVGALVGAATHKPCEGSCFFIKSSSDAAGFGAVSGMLPGLLLGAFLGSAFKTEKWGPISVESVSQIRIVPVGKGVVVQRSFALY